MSLVSVGIFTGCSDSNKTMIQKEVSFFLNDSTYAKFPVDLALNEIRLQNGGETLVLEKKNDSTFLVPVFGGSWNIPPATTQGYWVDSLRGKNYTVNFKIQNQTPFPKSSTNFSGTWDVWFGKKDTSLAPEAEFDVRVQKGVAQGTFRTTTGDYRYFLGRFENNQIRMQTYDGAHLYYVEALLEDGDWVDGHFYSGNHYHSHWQGIPTERLKPKGEVTILEPEPSMMSLSVIHPQEGRVELPLLAEEHEVLVVDILGTWCPNCMDEVRLLRDLQVNHPHVKLLSVAFERDTVPQNVFDRLGFYQSQLDVNWDFYWGGKASKTFAASVFPFLDKVTSFPTTLFIYPNGSVAVHRGFNGPATGVAYEEEVRLFNQLMSASSPF